MSFFRKLIAILYPERCPYCKAVIEAGQIACDSCLKKLEEKRQPVISGVGGYRCVSSFLYGGAARRMILNIKYRERVQFIAQAAPLLADDVKSNYNGISFDLITCVPLHKRDLRQRGYNQSELLARELGRLLDLPYADTLQKVKRTKKQHTLKRKQRLNNLKGAFKAIDKSAVKGKNILIIDDVVTTGTTLRRCCDELTKAKAGMICCAALAKAKFVTDESAII